MIFDITESSTVLTGSVNYRSGIVPENVVGAMIQDISKILHSVNVTAEEPIGQFQASHI
jgi:hypothetical protein